jgi:hypothetical protein
MTAPSPEDAEGLERVARAIWNAYSDAPLNAKEMPGEPRDWRTYGDLSEEAKADARRYARAAIAAMDSHAEALRAENARLREALLDLNAHEQAPCILCSYNGPGFYQAEMHRCVAEKSGIMEQTHP